MSTMDIVRADFPYIATELPGPRSRAIIERDSRVLSPSYTRSYPMVAERAEGAIVEDPDGNRFLDLNAGIAVVATGHCHPRVVEAIQRQSAKLIHMSGTDFYYENMVTLAEKLAEIAPGACAAQGVFRQLGHGGDGSFDEAGAVRDWARQVHRLLRRLPRANARMRFR